MRNEYMRCRRTNYVQAAYVEGAVHINRRYGSDRAYWMLIREQVPGPVIERVLHGDRGCVRHKDRRYSTRRETAREPEPSLAVPERREDHLTSQRVDVSYVFLAMMGTDAAKDYLRTAGVPVWVTDRVLNSTNKRASPVLALE